MYSMDGLPGLLSSRTRAGKLLQLDEVKRWLRSVWLGKLDAVLLGWLIGVFIAIINEVVNRYGGEIRAASIELVDSLQKEWNRRV
jgi:hypothetical protein